MTIERIRTWTPLMGESTESLAEWVKQHHRDHQEESTARIEDFLDILCNDITCVDLTITGKIDADYAEATATVNETRYYDHTVTMTADPAANAEVSSGYFALNKTGGGNGVYILTGLEGVARSSYADEAGTFRGVHGRTYTSAGTTASMRTAIGGEFSVRAGYSGGTACVAEGGTCFTGVRIWMAPYFSSGSVSNLNNFWGLWIYGEHATQRNADSAIKISDAGGGFTVDITLQNGETISNATNGIVETSGHFGVRNQNEVRFYDNGNYVGFEAPALSANQIWVLPTADGDAGQVLRTSGAGNGVLSWATAAAGAGVVELDDTNASNKLTFDWSEDASADYILDWKVNSAARTISLSGNLTVEASSIISQDYSTDASPTFDDLTISTPSNIYALSHDSFADFDANKHIDHTGVTLTAGTGLTGGGTIAAGRTFDVDVGITDNKIVRINDADAANYDYAQFTAFGLRGRSYAETRADLNLNYIYNVKVYGATGDGTTDDATAIQAAIDACGTAGGGTVLFPPGDYLIKATLTITDPYVTLSGTHPHVWVGGSTVITAHSDVTTRIIYVNTANSDGSCIRNLRIYDNDQALAGIEYAQGVANPTYLENISVENCAIGIKTNGDSSANGFEHARWTNVMMDDCLIGVQFGPRVFNFHATGCYFGGLTTCMIIGEDSATAGYWCQAMHFSHCDFAIDQSADAADYMVVIYNSTGVIFTNCHFEWQSSANQGDAMLILGVTGVATGTQFIGCRFNGNGKVDEGIELNNAVSCNVIGGYFAGIDNNDILFTSSTNHFIAYENSAGVGRLIIPDLPSGTSEPGTVIAGEFWVDTDDARTIKQGT